MDGVHPIGKVLSKAAAGDFPAVDGGWQRVGPWRPGVEGGVAFTGHPSPAVDDDVSDGTLASLGPDGFGGASNPRVVARLAGTGWIDALDIVLVGASRPWCHAATCATTRAPSTRRPCAVPSRPSGMPPRPTTRW